MHSPLALSWYEASAPLHCGQAAFSPSQDAALILPQQPTPSPGWALAEPVWDSKGLRVRGDEVVMRN